MQEGKIDFGVVTGPLQVKGDMELRPVRKVRDVFVAGSKFEQLKGKILPLRVLEELPIICLEKNTSTRRYMDEFLRENQVVLNPEIELATSDMLVQFARRNLGVASVVEAVSYTHLQSGLART